MIKSVAVQRNKLGPYAFICFADENDKEAGPKAAEAAVKAMHGKEVGKNANQEELRLFVTFHRKKSQYEQEKQ